MASVKFLETTSAKLASLPCVNGRFIFVTDKGLLYRDTDSAHILVSGPPILMLVTDHENDYYQTLAMRTTDSYMNVTVKNGAVLEFSFIQ